jgi:hypothetical protein
MASGDGFECGLEIGVGLDAVQLAGLDKRRDAGPGSATFVMARDLIMGCFAFRRLVLATTTRISQT